MEYLLIKDGKRLIYEFRLKIFLNLSYCYNLYRMCLSSKILHKEIKEDQNRLVITIEVPIYILVQFMTFGKTIHMKFSLPNC